MKSSIMLAVIAGIAGIAVTGAAAPRHRTTPVAATVAPAVEGQTAQPAPHDGLPYLLHLPRGYSAASDQRWPVIVFLHGSGERGTDIERVKLHGPPQLVGDDPAFPFIVISPQLPESEERWGVAALDATLDAAIAGLRVDRHRIYLTGLSLGGIASWDWAIARPDRFAAVAPVAALGSPDHVCALRDVPLWVFHGDSDPVVPRDEDLAMVRALEACGGHPRLTVYPATGHNSWDATYGNAALYLWFLEQRRP